MYSVLVTELVTCTCVTKEMAQGSIKACLSCRTWTCGDGQAEQDSAWLGIFHIIFPADYQLWKFEFSVFQVCVSCWNRARKKLNSPLTYFFFPEWNFRQHERFVLPYLLLCLLSHSVVPSLCVLAYVSWKSTYGSKTSCIFPEIQERMRLAILPKLKWAKIGCCSNLLHFWFQ